MPADARAYYAPGMAVWALAPAPAGVWCEAVVAAAPREQPGVWHVRMVAAAGDVASLRNLVQKKVTKLRAPVAFHARCHQLATSRCAAR